MLIIGASVVASPLLKPKTMKLNKGETLVLTIVAYTIAMVITAIVAIVLSQIIHKLI